MSSSKMDQIDWATGSGDDPFLGGKIKTIVGRVDLREVSLHDALAPDAILATL